MKIMSAIWKVGFGVALVSSITTLGAFAQQPPAGAAPAGMDASEEVFLAATLAADHGGSGPIKAVMTVDSSLHTHTLYRPEDLSQFGGDNLLPIMVWGNGACVNIGNRFRYFLTEIASHGYFIAAIGPIGAQYAEGHVRQTPPGVEPPPREPGSGQPTDWTQLIDAIDWAIAENSREGSIYYGKLDPTKIAVAGQSCGGVQAVAASADPRVTTSMIMNSGTFPDNGSGNSMGAGKENLKDFHGPVLYVTGDSSDVAYPNADDDFERINQVPIVRAYEEGVGHIGTYRTVNGGSFAVVARNWLDWQLKGKESGRAWFVGDDSILARDPNWVIRAKNLD